ncbi:hypothetical protein GDO81_008768 [Engystomops pustulosus]|uniref:Fatty acid hydroxylase domain-containing protein n=1 Tax=Engystomops pustulosus TaxID=76066 RepID=A0AAV7CGX3_ENGPU|nr:hypothetical protein GDO81_008768 [Engystomops pustulosus]
MLGSSSRIQTSGLLVSIHQSLSTTVMACAATLWSGTALIHFYEIYHGWSHIPNVGYKQLMRGCHLSHHQIITNDPSYNSTENPFYNKDNP